MLTIISRSSISLDDWNYKGRSLHDLQGLTDDERGKLKRRLLTSVYLKTIKKFFDKKSIENLTENETNELLTIARIYVDDYGVKEIKNYLDSCKKIKNNQTNDINNLNINYSEKQKAKESCNIF